MNEQLFPMVILAGGMGTRLHPITKEIPKALVEINGRPFIYHQLNLIRKKGIQHVILCLGYLGENIIEFLKDSQDLDLNIMYSFDGINLMGTGGAIKKALPLILNENFFVTYGDAYLNCDYHDVQNCFMKSQKLGLMTVYHNNNQWDESNVEYVKPNILDYDKNNKTKRMQHIDYGLGIFNKKAFEFAPDNANFDLMVFYKALLQNEQLAGYEVQQRFYEIGSREGIDTFSKHLLSI